MEIDKKTCGVVRRAWTSQWPRPLHKSTPRISGNLLREIQWFLGLRSAVDSIRAKFDTS